jgi:DNA polymerase-3 subunit gamma/tau
MPYLSLYRKYRSQNFDEIVGQEHVTTTLRNAIERGRIAHAYLFSGPRGTGKTSAARIMAKCINCESGPTPTPCNTCPVCTAITKDKLFDVIEIDAASNRGIDDVRDLKEKVRVPPSQARRKVYIIDEVHMLTREAFNALLKTLEEPPEHVLFIMATTEPQKLPPTILSRCQRFDFRRLTDAEIAGHIRSLCSREGYTIDDGAADLIVKSADGSMRDSISILDQLVSFSDGAITAADATLMFGLVEKSEIITFMEAVFSADAQQAFELFQKFFDAGKSFSLFLRLVMELLRDIYLLRQGLNPPRDTYTDAERDALRARARALPRPTLVALMDEVARVEDRIRWEVYPRIILEILIIKMIDLASGADQADAARPAPAKSKAPAKPRPVPAAPEPVPANQPAPAAQESPQADAVPQQEPDPEDPPEELDPAPDGGFDAAWKSILQSIRKKNLPRYLVFADAAAHMPDENTIVLSYAPENRFKKESAQEKDYADLLRQAASEKFGRDLRILFRIDRGGDDETPPQEAEERAVEPEPQPVEPEAQNLSLFEQINETFPNNKELT